MTTGYVARMLDENLDLNAFAWMIFGSLIPLYDASIDEAQENLDKAEKELADWRAWPEHVKRSIVESEVLHHLAHYTRERAECVAKQGRIDAMAAQIAELKPGPKALGIVQYLKDQLTSSTLPVAAIDETLAELASDTYVDEMIRRRESDLTERVTWRKETLQQAINNHRSRRETYEQLVAAVGPPPIKTEEPE